MATYEEMNEELGEGLRLYRQPSGCLEVAEGDEIVHVCSSVVPEFYQKLGAFIERTDKLVS